MSRVARVESASTRSPMVGIGPGQGWFRRDLPRSRETWKRLLLGEGQGFESPQLHQNTRSMGQSGILNEEDGVATRQKLGTSSPFLAFSRPGLGSARLGALGTPAWHGDQ